MTYMRRLKSENFVGSRGDAGFTVIELVVAFAILAIVAVGAVPAASELYDSFNRFTAETLVIEDLRRAQLTTVQEGCQGIFKMSADGSEYQFGCDYVPFSTSASPAIETTLFTRELPARVTMSTDATVIFNTRGQVIGSDGYLTSRTVTMYISGSQYNSGTLRPTGFFEFDH